MQSFKQFFLESIQDKSELLTKEDLFADLKSLDKRLGFGLVDFIPAIVNGVESSKLYKMTVDNEHRSHIVRASIMKQIVNEIAGKYDAVLVGGNPNDPTAVVFRNVGIRLQVKPASTQGMSSAGIANEYALADMLNALIENEGEPIDICFRSTSTDGTKELVCKRIFRVEQCGKDASDRSKRIKADVRLYSIDKDIYSLSLKKTGAAWVENGSVYGHDWYVPTILNAIDTGKTTLVENEYGYTLTPTICWDMTDEEKHNALFGNDILPDGAVIEATFSNDSLKEEINEEGNKRYVLPVDYIITSLNDLTCQHDIAWFAINHHNRPGHWRGIYVRAAFMYRKSKNVVQVERA